jgi:hypothetical protein
MAEPTNQQNEQSVDKLAAKVKSIQAMAATLGMDLKNFQFSGDLITQAGQIEATFERLQDRLLEADKTFASINAKINSSLGLITNQRQATQKLTSVYRSLGGIVDKLLLDEQSISKLSKGEITNLLKKTQLLKVQAEAQKSIIEATPENERSEEQVELLASLKKEQNAYVETITALERRLKLEGKIQSAAGITGGLLDNLSKLGVRAFGGLGINLAALGVSFDDAEKDIVQVADAFSRVADNSMTAEEAVKIIKELTGKDLSSEEVQKLADALGESGKSAEKFQIRLLTLKAGLKGIGEGLKEAFVDPLIPAAMVISKVSKAIFNAFLEVDKATVDFERLNGSASSLNIQMMSYNMTLTDTVDLLKQAASFTQQTGFNAEAFSKEIITGAAEAVNLLGLTNEQAGKLGIIATATGRSFEATKNNLIGSVNSFNAMNKTAVSHGLVMRDVANTSDAVAASLGSSEKRIAGAAAAARRLGLELKDLDSIASSLLDFESSIEAELEAQLLTGRALNLTKARELALSNDLEGVGKELFNNSASLFEFGKLNRIQQEGYAKALGLSRDQLAKIAYQRAIENKLTGEALKNATGMNAEQLEAMELTVMMEKAMSKLAQTFVPIVSLAAEYSAIILPVVGAYVTLQMLSKSILALETIRAGIAARQLALETATNAQRLIGFKRLALQAAAAAAANPVKALLGLAAAGAVVSYFTSKGDDVVSTGQGYGQRTLLMPEGAIALNDKDTVIAGTNLTGGTNTNSRSNDETNQLLRQLIAETRKGKNIYLGPSKVSENLEVYA